MPARTSVTSPAGCQHDVMTLGVVLLSPAGIVLAAELNRTVILPHLLLNGTQPTEAEVNENTSGSVPFG